MSTYTLKSIARRGMMLGAAFAVLAATVIPASSVFADALNPLTQRSLLLSSSAPGYQDSDGANSSEVDPNAIGENYAPPGSGPNGKKSGETFTFKVSTDSAALSRPIKAFTLQYCTSAAGKCQSPGNNTGDARAKEPALNSTDFANPTYSDTSTWLTRTPNRGADSLLAKTSDLNVNYSSPLAGTDFQIFVDANDDDLFTSGEEVTTTGSWSMATSNVEDLTHSQELTGAKNFITLSSATGVSPATETKIKIVFNADTDDYITNPGDDSFFVKLNSYDSATTGDHIPATPAISNTHIIDGGVTVANVMTDSIHITTKVLETMSFSVGTRNRDTVTLNCADPADAASAAAGCIATSGATHGTCDNIQQVNDNRLQLGNPDAEYSLETDTTWDVYSYWRLSSNSSGGATVYYSGDTLANTVGDSIDEIGETGTISLQGTEQFGLGFVDATTDDTGKFDSAFTALVSAPDDRFHMPTLNVLVPGEEYEDGAGDINTTGTIGTDAKFAFASESNTIPRVIAQNNEDVISCDTAKMRYIANIGADTPAGVYTTKINYLAAPQY